MKLVKPFPRIHKRSFHIHESLFGGHSGDAENFLFRLVQYGINLSFLVVAQLMNMSGRFYQVS